MITDKPQPADATLVRTGIEGLDDVLQGGLPCHRLYLVEGDPGSGKTTLGLQFLLEGAAQGEPCLFVTLSETAHELNAAAESHGWNLKDIRILEIMASEESLKLDTRYTMYHPSEVELSETMTLVLAEAEKIKPARAVFDSLSELRLLAENPLRYRRQIIALKQYFSRRDCTLLFVDDRTGPESDMHLHSLAAGVIGLERQVSDYGAMRRRLQVSKMRAKTFREGYHDFVIRSGGIHVYPRLVAAEHRISYAREAMPSGLASLDSLLGGGLGKGTSTLILGAAGTGKSSLGTQFAHAAAARQERPTVFLFDESIATYHERSRGLGMNLESVEREERLKIRQVDPAELSPGEFAQQVRQAVEREGCRFIVIDSLNGYLNAMPNERFLTLHLHELLTYLGQQGVTTLLLMTQLGLVGANMQAPVDASYLADTVVLLRYFEVRGELCQAISVIKKRTGAHERAIREMSFGNGIQIGEPLRDFQGVLTGVPHLIDGSGQPHRRD